MNFWKGAGLVAKPLLERILDPFCTLRSNSREAFGLFDAEARVRFIGQNV